MTEDRRDKGPQIEEVELDPRLPPEIQKAAIGAEENNAERGRTVGLLVIVLGILLIVGGISGVIDLNIEGAGIKASLLKASPGLVIVVIGAAVIYWSNLKIKAAK